MTGMERAAGQTRRDATNGISVVINTLNEEANLARALRSVRTWADEIVVVDMQSDDATKEIARSFGARVFDHPRMGFADPARSYAVAQASHEWILILDADELVPRSLAIALRQVVDEGAADVVFIPRHNFFAGAPIEGNGWGPRDDRYPRFFRRGALELTPRIHDFMHPLPGVRVKSLPPDEAHALAHFAYLDVSSHLQKLNRYTSIEASTDASGTARKRSLLRALRAISLYALHSGHRDGWRGVYLAAAFVFYRVAVWAKARELGDASGGDVTTRYAAIADRIIREYEVEGEPYLGLSSDPDPEANP